MQFSVHFVNSISFRSSERTPPQMADPRLNQARNARDLAYLLEKKKEKERRQFALSPFQPVPEASEDALPPHDAAALPNEDEPICEHGKMEDLREMYAKLEEEKRKGNIVECMKCGFDYALQWLNEQGVCVECEPSAADGSPTRSSQGQSQSSGAEPIADAGGQDQSGAASEPAAADTTESEAIWV